MILERKDKVKKQFEQIDLPKLEIQGGPVAGGAMSDAISALMALEYRRSDIQKVLGHYKGDHDDVEAIIKFGLLNLSTL